MYNIKLEDYIPAPRPATTDRIVAAHYYAAWKKDCSGIHNGFDDLHDFPERTPLMGYYDEENPVVSDFETKWALEHGINCFIHCWYRYKEFENMPVKREHLRCVHALHEGFFHSKYQSLMNFAIMFENNPRWANTTKDDLLNNLMPFWYENYFRRENYLKIDNKPVLFVCQKHILDDAFSSVDEQLETFEKCREYMKEKGFSGLIIACCLWGYQGEKEKEIFKDCDNRGYDFHFTYSSSYSPEKNYPSEEEIFNGQCDILKSRFEISPLRHTPTVSCFRDCTPRHSEAWAKKGYEFFRNETIYHQSPENFRKIIKKMKEMADALPENSYGRKIFMIDNWNEWDEGHYVAPSHEFGFKYLQAIREELTLRDNLPDYRTPSDLGITDLNSSWEEPDLSEICKKKYRINPLKTGI